MRNITKKAIHAFTNHINFNQSNTGVVVGKDLIPSVTLLTLHGNTIAQICNGILSITNAGWFSNTTKERLNGLPGVNIYQKDFTWFLNGKQWDGKWIEIGKI